MWAILVIVVLVMIGQYSLFTYVAPVLTEVTPAPQPTKNEKAEGDAAPKKKNKRRK